MKTIDLEKIIADQSAANGKTIKETKKELGKSLFPEVKYPNLAINRIIEKEAVLDANQISKLSLTTGIPIEQLFGGERWKQETKEGVHYFDCGEFKAELDTKTWMTKIYDSKTLFHESVIHTGTMSLQSYLEKLNSIIINK